MTETHLPTNWGRWGDGDQLGTLHLIDAAARRRAAAEVREARHVSLARRSRPVPLTTGLGPVGSPATMPAGVLQAMNFNGARPLAMTDTLVVNTHNAALTHLDAVAHIPVEERVYPGVPVHAAVTPTGVTHGSADPFGEGIVTRGVLLDLAPGGAGLPAGARIGSTDLDAALERAGTTLSAGDAVAVRGGWDTNQPLDQPVPGLDLSAVRWLDEHGVSVYAGDIGDARPAQLPLPMHQVALARLGLPLVDAADLEALAELCEASSRWSFMLVLAPPRITGTTGLVVNPIAIL
ncbi:cyclase family protein [Streptomyces montanisoli]|uniref:Cyclase family protein n=1 Tax=Streptomyces montanisoli TaxID=2798581 RepID=A0A940MEI8_9ACTN|nr:cyclase family protein [Streptomyces montanisoli]MBP0457218.1 cyclase family protein [Streptomyces montanisoli]